MLLTMLSLLESLMRVISFRKLHYMLKTPKDLNTIYKEVKFLVCASPTSLKIKDLQKEQSAGNYILVKLID